MEFVQTIGKRRACREFASDPVPRDLVEKLVYAANRAPTACNLPYRHLMIVDDWKVIKSIRQVSPSLLADPPLLILVITDLSVAKELIGAGPLAEWSAFVDSGAAGENILLAATDLGLASQFTMIPTMAGIQEILHLPSNFRVDLVIPIGYPMSQVKSVRARKRANIIYHNRYGEMY